MSLDSDREVNRVQNAPTGSLLRRLATSNFEDVVVRGFTLATLQTRGLARMEILLVD